MSDLYSTRVAPIARVMALSELEKQRHENIARNKELLRKLQLDSFGGEIAKEIAKPEKKRKPAVKRAKLPQAPAEPTRKLRRLAGVKTEDTAEFARLRAEEEEQERQRKELEKLKLMRLFGDFKLIDLIANKKGGLQFKNKVHGQPEIKVEAALGDDPETYDVDIDDKKRLLDQLSELGGRVSTGDFFNEIRESQTLSDDAKLDKKRAEFDNLHIYKRFDPLSIKITHNRVTLLVFHPSTTDRLVVAGDTTGCMGIWAVDDDGEEPAITILKPHGKLILKILVLDQKPLGLYLASYDGLIRMFDLQKQESVDMAYVNDPWENNDFPLGISDINWCGANPHILYLTTLEGNFYRFDTREKFKLDANQLLRCHDKKIGLFAVNPNSGHQIATASLDRTMRVWDLRATGHCEWSDFAEQTLPHLYGGYTLRLSVSGVDWNDENRLVFNGYDDHIQLVNLDAVAKSPVNEWSKTFTVDGGNPHPKEYDELPLETIKPFNTIRHNCQTGRWVLILKLKWQHAPEDGVQKFIIANMNRGLDIYDQQGQILAHLNEDVGAVPAVCTLHPTKNWAVGGSANGKVYLFE